MEKLWSSELFKGIVCALRCRYADSKSSSKPTTTDPKPEVKTKAPVQVPLQAHASPLQRPRAEGRWPPPTRSKRVDLLGFTWLLLCSLQKQNNSKLWDPHGAPFWRHTFRFFPYGELWDHTLKAMIPRTTFD